MSVTPTIVYGYAQDLLRMVGDTSGLPGLEEDRTLNWISDLQEEFFERFREAGLSLPTYMQTETGFQAVPTTNLAASTSAGAVTVTIDDSAALAASGEAVVYSNSQPDVFSFTGNSAGNVTGVSGLDVDHEEDDVVQQLYALPADFSEFRRSKDTGEGVTVNGFPLYETSGIPSGVRFRLHENEDGDKFLWLPQTVASGGVQVFYERKPTPVTTITTPLAIRSPHHSYLVQGLVAIFKQVLDEDYVPEKERLEMDRIFRRAQTQRTVGRAISAGNSYFDRLDSGENIPWVTNV